MSEFSQKELAELLDVGYDKYNMLIANHFGHSIDKSELFDTYKKKYDEQTTKNHLECYNQIRELIFKKCLNEVKYAQIEAIKNIYEWSEEQMELFINTVIKNLFIKYGEPIIFEKDFDSIIKSYLIYRFNEDIDVHLYKTHRIKKHGYGIDDGDDNFRMILNVLMIYIKRACISSPKWKKELEEDQIKLIDMYRTYFLHKSPIIDCFDETSKPQYKISMDYTCEFTPEFYSLIFHLYLMGNNKFAKTYAIKNVILGSGDPKETYEYLIINLWQWAQKEKGQLKNPPQKLKKFCCDVLGVVCNNNSYVRYNYRHFLNVNFGWERLRKQNENIKKKFRTLNKYKIHPLFRV